MYTPAVLSCAVFHRYGACCSDASVVMPAPFTMILLFATSDSNTGMPSDWSVASITMNGFFAATASASARCAASSLPDDCWNSSSTVRPHVW